jgi:hypothetical protein
VAGTKSSIRLLVRCDANVIEVSVAGLPGLAADAFILPPGEERRLVLKDA